MKKIHQKLIDLPTLLVSHGHFTWELQKSFFNYIIHVYLLFTLSRKNTNCNRNYELAHHTWDMSPHYLVNCRSHSSDGRYIVSLQTFVALKRRVVLRGTGGCEKSQLCCVATWTSQQVFKVTTICMDTRSQSFLPLINRIVHGAVLKFSPSQQAAAATRPYRGLVLGINASASCPKWSKQPGLAGLTTCQDWWTGVSHTAEARLCHERDVLVHCLGGRQTPPCGSLAAALASATRLDSTV